MKSFENKVAIVTGGGGSGIGNALCRALAKKGAKLAFCDVQAVEKTEEELKQLGADYLAKKVDVSQLDQLESFVNEVFDKFGRVDILINNAGIASGDITFDQISLDDFERITAINYWGVVRLTKLLYPHLLSRPESALVNLSSAQGSLAAPYLVSYCTTKFAVRGFTDSLRAEHYFRGIKNMRIHCVQPGAVSTQITLNAKYQGKRSESFHEMLQKQGSSPDKAAKIILNGIRKKRARIFINDGAFQDLLARLLPTYFPAILKIAMKIKGMET